jgi:hypothetical protein
MTSDAFKQGLMEMYQGEVIGEVLFDRLLAYFDDPTQRYKVAVMLQLETETKARLRPALMALGLDPAEHEESRKLGHEVADGLKGMSWDEAMAGLREGIKPYVDRYRELAAAAPSEYRAIAESMVTHEQSLYRFTELECAGERDNSLDDIIAQLNYPLPSP